MWYNIIVGYRKKVIPMKKQKKTAAEILSEIDSNLDIVLSILSKLALVAMSIATIVQIIHMLF